MPRICALSVSIKVITATKARTACPLAKRTICGAQTHWPHDKDITTKEGGGSHPHYHQHHPLPSPPPPPGTDTQSVYMCAHEGGWWFGEKWHRASTEPAKYLCLHNIRGQTRQAGKLGRHEEMCCEKYTPPPFSLERFPPHKGRKEKVAAIINSLSIRSPGCTRGSVRWGGGGGGRRRQRCCLI